MSAFSAICPAQQAGFPGDPPVWRKGVEERVREGREREWRGEVSERKEVEGGVGGRRRGEEEIPLTTHCMRTSHLLSQ